MFNIKIEELTHKYPDGMQAQNGTNIDVREGEFLAILGANGSVKTMFNTPVQSYLPEEVVFMDELLSDE